MKNLLLIFLFSLLYTSPSIALLGDEEDVPKGDLLNCSVKVCFYLYNTYEAVTRNTYQQTQENCSDPDYQYTRWDLVTTQAYSPEDAMEKISEELKVNFSTLHRRDLKCNPVIGDPTEMIEIQPASPNVYAEEIIANPNGSITIFKPNYKTKSMDVKITTSSSKDGTCLLFGYRKGGNYKQSSRQLESVKIDSDGALIETGLIHYHYDMLVCSGEI